MAGLRALLENRFIVERLRFILGRLILNSLAERSAGDLTQRTIYCVSFLCH